MKSSPIQFILVSVVTVLLFAVSACTPVAPANTGPVTSKLTKEQAIQMGENALQAINSGDFAAYSRDWDDSMKVLKESDFKTFREGLLNQMGKYKSIASVELVPAKTAGFIRWDFTVNFEKGQQKYYLTFKVDGDKVMGAGTLPLQ